MIMKKNIIYIGLLVLICVMVPAITVFAENNQMVVNTMKFYQNGKEIKLENNLLYLDNLSDIEIIFNTSKSGEKRYTPFFLKKTTNNMTNSYSLGGTKKFKDGDNKVIFTPVPSFVYDDYVIYICEDGKYSLEDAIYVSETFQMDFEFTKDLKLHENEIILSDIKQGGTSLLKTSGELDEYSSINQIQSYELIFEGNDFSENYTYGLSTALSNWSSKNMYGKNRTMIFSGAELNNGVSIIVPANDFTGDFLDVRIGLTVMIDDLNNSNSYFDLLGQSSVAKINIHPIQYYIIFDYNLIYIYFQNINFLYLYIPYIENNYHICDNPLNLNIKWSNFTGNNYNVKIVITDY